MHREIPSLFSAEIWPFSQVVEINWQLTFLAFCCWICQPEASTSAGKKVQDTHFDAGSGGVWDATTAQGQNTVRVASNSMPECTILRSTSSILPRFTAASTKVGFPVR